MFNKVRYWYSIGITNKTLLWLFDSVPLQVLNRSPESCFVCPSPSPRMERYLQSPRLERTSQKRCISPRNRLEHHDFLEKTPVKQVSQDPQLPARSMTGSSHKTESNSDQLSPGYYAREVVNRSSPVRRIPDFPADYVDERRGVRKQLVFESHPRRQEGKHCWTIIFLYTSFICGLALNATLIRTCLLTLWWKYFYQLPFFYLRLVQNIIVWTNSIFLTHSSNISCS